MDEDEVAFKAKQAAGTVAPLSRRISTLADRCFQMQRLEKTWPKRQRARGR